MTYERAGGGYMLPGTPQKSYKFFCRGLDIRVPQIVKTNLFQVIFFQQYLEVLGYKIGFNQVSHSIYIDIFQIILTVTIAAYFLVNTLFCFQITKQTLEGWNQRQCPTARFCLCRVLIYDLALPTHGKLDNRMPYADGFLFKIDGIPFQSNNLTTSQAIESANDNRKL